MSTLTSTTKPTEFISYEYATLSVDRTLESLYIDTFHNLGWEFIGYVNPTTQLTDPHSGVTTTVTVQPPVGDAVDTPEKVAIRFKRDRRLGENHDLRTQQHEAVDALAEIAKLEGSTRRAAVATGLSLGLLGAGTTVGALAAAIAGAWLLAVPLAVLGVACFTGGLLGHRRARDRHATASTNAQERHYIRLDNVAHAASSILSTAA